MAHILVVHADRDVRETIRFLLEFDAGHAVQEAATGKEALALLRSSTDPLVVVLDDALPDMSGLALIRAIQADQDLATRHAYILLTQTPGMKATLPECITLWLAAPVITEPFALETFLQAITQASAKLALVPPT